MDKQQAQRIVQEVLGTSFDKSAFIKLTKELFNEIDESKAFHARGYVPEAYKKYVKTYERIATYTDPDDLKIDILIVYLQNETTLERARTSQRNFIAHYLKERDQKDAGLVAFVSPDPADWRFSLVKIDYKIDEKGKVKDDFTPARRWSFLVGANENSHTARSRLSPLILDDAHNPTLAALEEAFNIETVTKEFFTEYRDLFIRVKEALDHIVNTDVKIKNNFAQCGVNTVDFAKKLLGQIIFLYFLQKKGWFGVGRDADWGTGSKQFLRELFEEKHGNYGNFFNDILEPLFYEALRIGEERKLDDYYYSRFNCKIPFLNGGLFDPLNNYDWVHTDILIPNELFSNKHKTAKGDTGSGILDIFDRYNFTVKEDEPLEKEVAIDPELLGKAYEKFNAIRPDNFAEYQKALKSGKKGEESKFNKQFGVYYTPREIVHYMCQQSLINYLYTEFNDGMTTYEKLGIKQTDMLGNMGKSGQLDLTIEHKERPAIPKEDIETLIHYGERITETEAIAIAKEENISAGKQKTTKTKSFLSESIRSNAQMIDEKLSSIKVCDPAIGSGAFPVGMMTEIVRTRNVLSNFIKDNDRSPYRFKREFIENSLYGVDIDSGAVEIAKLRLWLSLVVDEDDIKQIKPLPNLDYKIVCGNSLIGFPEGWDSPATQEIESLKHDFFSETNPTKKKELKEKIDGKINDRYKNSLKIFGYEVNFDFRMAFSEVFHEKNGFDVVIANPPYGAELRDEQKKFLKKRHAPIIERIRNTFLYFLGEAYNQARENGVVCFILPNELLFQIYMAKARKFFLERAQILFAVNLGEDVFEAIVPTCIICLKKAQQNYYDLPIADLREANLNELSKLLITSNFPVTTNKNIISAPKAIFCFDNKVAELINRFALSFQPFETFCDDIANGISTSCDEVYIVSDEFAEENCLENIYLKECIRGGQLNRFYCPIHTREYILYITDKFNCMIGKYIYKYLSKNKELLVKKSVEKKQGKREWHVLFRGRYEGLYQKPKILFRQTGDKIIAAIDKETGFYCIDSVNIAQVKSIYHEHIEYFLGLLNSRLMVFYYQGISQEKGRILAQVKPQRIRSLPINMGTVQQRKQITNLVNRIMLAKHDNSAIDTSVLEQEIDQIVYSLYGLTPEEIAIVEGKVTE